MPKEYVAESRGGGVWLGTAAGQAVLLPRAAVARDVIPTELERLGALVEVVEAYRNVIPENAAARAQEIFSGSKKPHWITFTSSLLSELH